MKLVKVTLCIALLAACLVWGPRARAVEPGQVDTFEDGTTQGWFVGLLGSPHPAPPVNIPTGGPAGADDNYLLLTALGGNGPGSRLAVINDTQWAGDYLSAGIPAITMDVNNFGQEDLFLRLLFVEAVGGPPTNAAISGDPILLPAGSGWQRVVFPIVPDALTAILGSTTDALSNATELRLFHNVAAAYPPEPVVASLGVDNIRAVPEPSTAFLMGVGLVMLGARRFVRRARP